MRLLICLCLATCFASFCIISGCKPDPSVEPLNEIAFEVPKGWPEPAYKFENNKVTNAGFELGKKLFFDPRLSRNNTISCGSCHQPFAAFAQLDHAVSHGVEDRLGTRNSPGLFNLNWHTGFFWDGGVNHIESQPLNPIKNPLEMDETLENILVKLNADQDYQRRFRQALGNDTINTQRILKALAQFMGMLVSSNSKYDKHIRGEAGGELTAAELNGLSIFRSNCSSCHSEPLFSDFSYRNNGLKPSVVNDSGRAVITRTTTDLHKFKVPSLRNLKYTGPYMHDGRITSLDKVLDHYATGIHQSATLDPILRNGIPLTAQERADLLSFLNTLNDEEFVKEAKFRQ